MAHDNNDVKARIAAIELLNKLAKKFGKDLCEHFVALEIMSMAHDTDQSVRKATVENLINVSEMVSTDYFINKLMLIYTQ